MSGLETTIFFIQCYRQNKAGMQQSTQIYTFTQQRLRSSPTVHSVVHWFTYCIQVTTTEPSNLLSLIYNTHLTVLHKKSYQKGRMEEKAAGDTVELQWFEPRWLVYQEWVEHVLESAGISSKYDIRII